MELKKKKKKKAWIIEYLYFKPEMLGLLIQGVKMYLLSCWDYADIDL